MAKKRKSAFAIYFTTILITLVLAGSTALFVYVKVTNMPKNPATTSTTADELGKYLPEVEQNQTILFILNGGETKTDTVFMLVRFLATEDKLILTPISGKTFAQINTKKSTVFDFYSKGGYLQAVDAVASATNVPVDKYVNFNKETFNTFIGVFGGVRFKVPEDVTYENPVTGEKTAIKAGLQQLDGTLLRQLLTYPDYSSEDKRMKLLGSVTVEMVNSSLGEKLYNGLDNSFNTVVNSAETNITAYDFSYRRPAMLHMIGLGGSVANFYFTSGEENSDGQFVISEEFKADLAATFDTKPIIE